MNIKYYKGDDHKITFRFKNLPTNPEDIIFEVKDIHGSTKIKKKLGDGIDFINDYYHIMLKPEDSLKIESNRKMIYIIKIIINGITYTVKKAYLKLL